MKVVSFRIVYIFSCLELDFFMFIVRPVIKLMLSTTIVSHFSAQYSLNFQIWELPTKDNLPVHVKDQLPLKYHGYFICCCSVRSMIHC